MTPDDDVTSFVQKAMRVFSPNYPITDIQYNEDLISGVVEFAYKHKAFKGELEKLLSRYGDDRFMGLMFVSVKEVGKYFIKLSFKSGIDEFISTVRERSEPDFTEIIDCLNSIDKV